MKLEPGEYVCSVCNGNSYGKPNRNKRAFPCYNCDGTGKVDWITNAMPKSFMFVLPKIRHVFPKLIAEQLCSVQPMKSPFKEE